MFKLAFRGRFPLPSKSSTNSSVILAAQDASFSSSSSVPSVPPKAEGEKGLVAIGGKLPFKAKRNVRKFKISPGGSDPFRSSFEPTCESQKGSKQFNDSFVNLYTIYGNIFTKEPHLLQRFTSQDPRSVVSYPLDESLIHLIQSSSRIWYDSGSMDSRFPSIVSIEGPSRRATWEAAKLVSITGKSHLALVPFSLFYELYHQCVIASKQQLENVKNPAIYSPTQNFSSVLNKALILEPRGNGISFKNGSENLPVSTSRDNQQVSRSVIAIVEYLFACLEASLGNPDIPSERFTLLIDGLQDFLSTRRGGDAALRDLTLWSREMNCRHVILGTRISTDSVSDGSHLSGEESKSEESSPNEDSSSPLSNGKNIAIQFIAELLSKGADKQISIAKVPIIEPSSSPVNVRIEGGTLRIQLTPPASDRRRRLLYSQLHSRDRLDDILDSNMIQIRSLVSQRWKKVLNLAELPSKHSHPSDQPYLRELFLSAGRGLLGKRRLNRDELNEILMLALDDSNSATSELEEISLARALDCIAGLRHDPTRMSTDDLNHLLAERHVSSSELNKYERRFLNCIATATTQTFFKDVVVSSETVQTLRALTSLPLTHPELFAQGILKHSMTGVLLFGPPGTGKTMLARAVAQESGAAFLAVNMSNIFDMWVGEGEKNVKGIFTLARKLAPCVIFIDEIDALLEKRTSSASGRSNRIEIVNEFMSQWDGLSSNLNSGVIVMGATNRPFVLDDAVLRRLPRRLLIDLPGEGERLQILRNLIVDNVIEPQLEARLPDIARRCQFYSGSDLKNVAITAGFKAALRCAADPVANPHLILTLLDFEEAIREVPASLSDQMDSLQELRRWNAMYGEAKEQWRPQKFGFA